jgi:hypothetical protein
MSSDDIPTPNNQNAHWRDCYIRLREDGETDECVMIHIPMVRILIEKYTSDTRKLDLNHPDYVNIEHQMCLWIYNRIKRPRDKVIELLSASLNCNPILLHNDIQLLEYLEKYGIV